MKVLARRHDKVHILEVIVLANAPDFDYLAILLPVDAVKASLWIFEYLIEHAFRVYGRRRPVHKVLLRAEMKVK